MSVLQEKILYDLKAKLELQNLNSAVSTVDVQGHRIKNQGYRANL